MCIQNIRNPTEQEQKEITIAYKVIRKDEEGKGKLCYEYWCNGTSPFIKPKGWNIAKHESILREMHTSDEREDIRALGFCGFKTLEAAKEWAWSNHVIAKIEIKSLTGLGIFATTNKEDCLIFERFRILEIIQ